MSRFLLRKLELEVRAKVCTNPITTQLKELCPLVYLLLSSFSAPSNRGQVRPSYQGSGPGTWYISRGQSIRTRTGACGMTGLALQSSMKEPHYGSKGESAFRTCLQSGARAVLRGRAPRCRCGLQAMVGSLAEALFKVNAEIRVKHLAGRAPRLRGRASCPPFRPKHSLPRAGHLKWLQTPRIPASRTPSTKPDWIGVA